MGGEVMFVEVSAVPGNGKLHLTGQLGDVIKESAQLALTWIQSKLVKGSEIKLNPKEVDIHVHLPSGAVAKDGPSAGLALVAAFASLFSQTSAKPGLAMTGEITLRGFVLPVGGIREKLSAAKRNGISHVILPRGNEADVVDLHESIRHDLNLIFVRRIEHALIHILQDPSRAFADSIHLNNSHL